MLYSFLLSAAAIAPAPAQATVIASNGIWDLLLRFIWLPFLTPLIIWGIKRFYNTHVSVKEVKKPTDPDIQGFKTLYNSRIKEELRIDAEEILKYIGRQENNSVEHYLYLCKRNKRVVGFVKFMVSLQDKYLFLAYIAVDEHDEFAKKCGVEKMCKKMIRKYFKPLRATHFITEIEQGNGGKYYTSFAKLINRYAKSFKHEAYYIDVPYIQPYMPGENLSSTPEDFLSLIYIPYYNLENTVLSKEEFLKIVNFIYFNIYGPSCNSLKCDCTSYNCYLYELVENYRNDYSDYINLISLGGKSV